MLKTKRQKVTNRIRQFLEEFDSPEKGAKLEQIRQLMREKCKKDLHFFAYHALEFHDIDTHLHRDMAHRYHKRIGHRFSLWLVPRGHLKTSLWTEAGTLWELINNPHLRFLVVNAKKENATDIVANIRSHVETKEIFRWLFPEYCWDLVDKSKARRCKVGAERLDFPCSRYAGAKEGNVEVMGVEASLVSKHYDRMIFDDAVNDLNTETMAFRNKVERWYKNALQLRHSPKESIVRIIGTRWHFNDLYSRLIAKEKKYRASVLARGKKVKPRYWLYIRKVVEKAPEGFGRDIVNKQNVLPIWPERFTDEVIAEIRIDNGSYIFSCQYMNNPLPDEDTVFKLDQIKIVNWFDIPDKITNFIAVDMAVDDKEDSDYSVVTVASFDESSRMYIRQIVRGKFLPNQTMEIIASMAEKWDARKVAIETQAFQKTVVRFYKEYSAREGWNIPWVEVTRGNTSKTRRFLALQPRVERGDFCIEEGIVSLDDAIEEMTTFSLDHKPAYDDILDTFADLEQIYYSAAKATPAKPAIDTYDGWYGSLEESNNDWGSEIGRGRSALNNLTCGW